MKFNLMLFAAAFLSTLFIETCSASAGTWIPASALTGNPLINDRFHQLFKP